MNSHTITSFDHPKTGLERYKKYQPKGGAQNTRKTESEHSAHTRKNMYSKEFMTFASGKVLVIDGSFWGENIEYYLGEVRHTLLEGEQSLRKYGLFPEHTGVLYNLEKIPGGYRQTHLGFYLVNPQALSKFTQEVLHT